MGDTTIAWTPRGEASAITLDLTTLRGLYRFEGFSVANAEKVVSVGGKTYSVIHDTAFVYHVEVRGVSRVSNATAWSKVSSFVSHADAGGEFAFKMDADKDDSSDLDGAATLGDTVITLTSAAWVAAGDILFFEDADDPTKWELRAVSSVSGADVTLTEGVGYSFVDASVVRDWEYFPTCIVLGDVEWEEREAGRGSHLWDLSFKFRTVR